MKILCLSFRTPPQIRPQAILIGKMLPEWLRQGIEPILVTYDNNGDLDLNIPLFKIPVFKLGLISKRIPVWRNFAEILYYLKIYRITKRVIRKHKIDLVFSFSNPQRSNVLGALVKKYLGIKFVSYFSDPWVDNPYEKTKFFGRTKLYIQEKFIINQSDKIIFPNNQLRELVMKKYSENLKKKALVIPHCFDPAAYPNFKKINEKFVFSYIGAFFKERNPELFFKALNNLFLQQPEVKDLISLNLVGSVNKYSDFSENDIRLMLKKYDLENISEIIPQVNYHESLKYMKQSDCLIVIDANFDASPFLPSKLIDYFGSGNLIIGITPESSVTAEFLEEAGLPHFNYNQSNELKAYLKSIILHQSIPNIDLNFVKKFEVKNTTAELKAVFSNLINNQ